MVWGMRESYQVLVASKKKRLHTRAVRVSLAGGTVGPLMIGCSKETMKDMKDNILYLRSSARPFSDDFFGCVRIWGTSCMCKSQLTESRQWSSQSSHALLFLSVDD